MAKKEAAHRWHSKAQTWSMDVIIAVVIVFAVFVSFFTLFNATQADNTKPALKDSNNILEKVKSPGSALSVMGSNEVNESRLVELAQIPFEELQAQTQVERQFCIYLEDENGNVIPINNTMTGVGSPDILVGGKSCS